MGEGIKIHFTATVSYFQFYACLLAHMGAGAHRGHKRAIVLIELELQAVLRGSV